MFKDVFVLKRRSVRARMMKYIWNLEPDDFSHMCPFFWLSLANWLIFPFMYVIRKGYWLISKFFHAVWKAIYNILKIVYKLMCLVFDPMYDSYKAWKIKNDALREERAKEAEQRRMIKQHEKNRKEQEKWRKEVEYYKAHPELLASTDRKSDKTEKKWTILNWLYRTHSEDAHKLQLEVDAIIDRLYKEAQQREQDELEKAQMARMNVLRKQFIKLCPDRADLLDNGDSWIGYLESFKTQKRQRDIELEAQARRRRKERIVSILKVIKPITTSVVYVLGGVALLTAIYYLCVFFKWAWQGISRIHINWSMSNVKIPWGSIGFWGLMILLLLLLVIGIRLLFVINYNRGRRYHNKTVINWNRIGIILFPFKMIWLTLKFCGIWTGRFFATTGKWIWNGILLFVQMAKNQCPAIKWED